MVSIILAVPLIIARISGSNRIVSVPRLSLGSRAFIRSALMGNAPSEARIE
ncbi:hypothetical protein [Falsiphaeobacter marinintestinus]|uniref:hypothetical protein n=1 Tax=Falsiphaeobacter marinintestinus TaxID=1492905 RepID=UPI001644BEE7|nr:hypothetical protein [Phaeobacter marinintestinus]